MLKINGNASILIILIINYCDLTIPVGYYGKFTNVSLHGEKEVTTLHFYFNFHFFFFSYFHFHFFFYLNFNFSIHEFFLQILLPGILLHGSFDFSLFFVGAISFIYDDESIMLTIITFAIAGGLTLGGIIYAYLSFQKVSTTLFIH